MPRKRKVTRNDLTMGYRIERLPRGVGKRQFYSTLFRVVRDNTALPAGWKVIWRWRNSQKQAMREAPVSLAVKRSRSGFVALMLGRIQRDAESMIPGFKAPKIRIATEREIEEIEE